MRMHRCENQSCKNLFAVTSSNVKRKWIVRGYKYEYYAYYIKCPICGEEKEVDFLKLPIKVILKFIFKK